MNKISGLYKIVNKTNGKFYIGSSDDIKRRFSRHLSDLKKNKHDNQHLQFSWNKYGNDNFIFEVYKVCDQIDLLIEEQKELDIWVGKDNCYNIRKDAKCPTARGEKRPEWVVKKYADSQRGKPKWNDEQKEHFRQINLGRKHSLETIEKFKCRKSSFENIKKAQESNVGRVYSENHGNNISSGKLKSSKIFTEEERKNISDGVQKAIQEGRHHKNKVPLNEYENIKVSYLSGEINQNKLALKYGITPGSMSKLLKKLGVK